MADPAMLQQALILESEANAREEEKAPSSNRKVDNGELSQALSHRHAITGRARESMVRQALDRSSLRGKFLDGGEVRDCPSFAGKSHRLFCSTDRNTNMNRNRGTLELRDACEC